MRKEFTRQLIHISGVFIVLLSYVLTWNQLLALCIAILIILVIFIRLDRIFFVPLFSTIFRHCRRTESEMGFIFFFIGIIITLCLFYFNQNIANAAILILLFGDAASTVIGKKFGRIKWPFQLEKTIEGSLAFLVVGVMVAITQVPFIPAIVGSAAGALIEVYSPIDDNIPIPIVSGFFITLMIYAGF